MASTAPPFPDAPPARPCPDGLPTAPCPGAPPTVEAQASLPEHVTEEILLRLPTAADLARASVAGTSPRCIIADHSFLRRFRTLHPPSLLGILVSTSFLPAQPPHPSTAAARALADTDFSCSFLPSRERPWIRRDFRDGRALLCVHHHDLFIFRDIAVCDPMHRRYLLLPPVPWYRPDLVDHSEAFLAPTGGDEGTDIATDAPFRFRVMCLAKYQTQLVLFAFSSSGPGAGQWHTVTFDGWRSLVYTHIGFSIKKNIGSHIMESAADTTMTLGSVTLLHESVSAHQAPSLHCATPPRSVVINGPDESPLLLMSPSTSTCSKTMPP
ncbi:uncharacterized protein LOC119332928 [Triticum dicoccoides]|uniref:uncharacterized protein LOC119332928 n=1 Tax=Triticum dicoccoides TaxID=85692 RepID=UPI001890DDB8|nr:uncharacterized protein LOC119332928 [Triticum dicoccoides]